MDYLINEYKARLEEMIKTHEAHRARLNAMERGLHQSFRAMIVTLWVGGGLMITSIGALVIQPWPSLAGLHGFLTTWVNPPLMVALVVVFIRMMRTMRRRGI